MAEQTPDGPAGGLTEYVNRSRAGHKRLPDGWCSCDKPLCPQRFLLDHIDDLIKAYQLKVQDLARETARNSVPEPVGVPDTQITDDMARLRAKLNGMLGALLGQGNALADEMRAAKELIDEIAAGLTGRTVVELPEPTGTWTDGVPYWNAESRVVAAQVDQNGRPYTRMNGQIWLVTEAEAVGMALVAAAREARRLSGGSQVGDQ